MKKKTKYEWPEEDIEKLKLKILKNAFKCKTNFSVSLAAVYGKYLTEIEKLSPDNYPIFLELLETGNRWVTDALLSKKDPETFFNKVQPSSYMIADCFSMLKKWKSGAIYPKTLLLILSILKKNYSKPEEGYRLYQLTIRDANALAKHLEQDKDQKYPLNKIILAILDSIASLMNLAVPEDDIKKIHVATQANNIRGKFLDIEKSLDEAIPKVYLKKGNYKGSEIAPADIFNSKNK